MKPTQNKIANPPNLFASRMKTTENPINHIDNKE